jgi:hypothetical protein
MTAPVLTTPRLSLRPMRPADLVFRHSPGGRA